MVNSGVTTDTTEKPTFDLVDVNNEKMLPDTVKENGEKAWAARCDFISNGKASEMMSNFSTDARS